MHMNFNYRLCHVLFAAGLMLPASFESNAKEWKVTRMTQLSPRLQTMFEKTKTVCFGRFMVDVPISAIAAWGRSIVPLSVLVYPDDAEEIKAGAQQFIEELKNEKNMDNNPLLISVDKVSQPEGTIVAGYADLTSTVNVRINGFFKLQNAGLIIKALPMEDRRAQVIANMTDIARRVRVRNETDVPTEPGNCIEHGFLPDEHGLPKENPGELIQIGFRLKEFPDTHLSISIRPAARRFNESNSLEWQLARLEKDLRTEDPNHIRLKTKYFRRGKRTLDNWGEGFEGLSRSPEQPKIHSIHDFGMDFQGMASDPLKPYMNVQMQTGIADNEAGAVKPRLTDAEAIAVWDRITSTIRVRPTGAAVVKNSEFNSPARFPLGELAATGRTCPQSGIWDSSEPSSREGGQRRYIKAGDIMPRVAVRGEPSLWQKIKGETPSHHLATVWKLVGYDDATAIVNIAEPTPPIAQALPETHIATNGASDNAVGSQSEEAPPKEKG